MMISTIGTLFIAIITLVPFFKYEHWIIRGMDFPRLQIAIIALVILIYHFIFLDLNIITSWVLIFISILCLLIQLWWILPYTLIWPKEVNTSKSIDSKKQLSIITSNVLQTNNKYQSLIDIVLKYQPDILVTLESNKTWEENLKIIESEMPYSVKCPLENLYGMHVYSKLPISNEEISYLVEEDIPSIHLTLELRTKNKVNIHFVHPAPPSPTENIKSTQRDAELITIARSVANTSEAVIVTGDLNDVAWSATTRLFRKISGLLDPRVGRGMFNTFHVDYFFLRWPLDHLFHSSHFTVKNIKRLSSIGSDHFSLYTVLVYEPAENKKEDGLKANSKDYAHAKTVSKKENISEKDVPNLNE